MDSFDKMFLKEGELDYDFFRKEYDNLPENLKEVGKLGDILTPEDLLEKSWEGIPELKTWVEEYKKAREKFSKRKMKELLKIYSDFLSDLEWSSWEDAIKDIEDSFLSDYSPFNHLCNFFYFCNKFIDKEQAKEGEGVYTYLEKKIVDAIAYLADNFINRYADQFVD